MNFNEKKGVYSGTFFAVILIIIAWLGGMDFTHRGISLAILFILCVFAFFWSVHVHTRDDEDG